MTTYTMTEDQKKMLTEKLLGECWHEYSDQFGSDNILCRKCGIFAIRHTFTTVQDAHDVMKVLVEKGEWDSFSLFALTEWWNEDGGNDWPTPSPKEMRKDFIPWLFINPARFCWLAAKYLEESNAV
ncbi:MAG: hypothetical protein WC302_00875 [Candidatus Paceibacterota bacterium]|jgi:hypothetical protein